MRPTYPRVENAKIVINFGNGRNGWTRIVWTAFLINRNSWRKTGYFIHVRLLHLAQELPGIGWERFHIAPLPLGKDVSKARDDLPEPERPVKTIILLRGISTVMFFRLCVRAPLTIIRSSDFLSFITNLYPPRQGLGGNYGAEYNTITIRYLNDSREFLFHREE